MQAEGLIMNKQYFSVLFVFTMTGVFACTTQDTASVQHPDAKVSRPDLAMPRDLAFEMVLPVDSVIISDAGVARDLLDVAPESTKVDATTSSLPNYENADSPKSTKVDATTSSLPDVFGIDRPNINPLPGKYAIRFDGEPTDARTTDIFPLDEAGFIVEYNATTGLYAIKMSTDYYRYDTFPVTGGEFAFSHGNGCPSDGYSISGSFVSPTEARGNFSWIPICRTANSGKFIATLIAQTTPDSGIDASSVAEVSSPVAPAFNPLPGHYTVRPDPVYAGSADSLGLLMAYGFTVTIDANGAYSFLHSIDGWARYTVSVTNGFFKFEHGAGFDGFGGTHCPTDGFGVRGSFISPTEARGVYGTMVRCQVNGPGHFIATLDQKADSGVVVDGD
jgi:hypothetical protein